MAGLRAHIAGGGELYTLWRGEVDVGGSLLQARAFSKHGHLFLFRVIDIGEFDAGPPHVKRRLCLAAVRASDFGNAVNVLSGKVIRVEVALPVVGMPGPLL